MSKKKMSDLPFQVLDCREILEKWENYQLTGLMEDFGEDDTLEGSDARKVIRLPQLKNAFEGILSNLIPLGYELVAVNRMTALPNTGEQSFHRDLPSDIGYSKEHGIQRLKSNRKPFSVPQLHVALHDHVPETGGLQFIDGSTPPTLKKGQGVFFDGNSVHRGTANTSSELSRHILMLVWVPKRLVNNPKFREILKYYKYI